MADEMGKSRRTRIAFALSLATGPSNVTLPIASAVTNATNASRKLKRSSCSTQSDHAFARTAIRNPDSSSTKAKPKPMRRIPSRMCVGPAV